MQKNYTIKHADRQRQINDFINLDIGATDVDGIIEYKNKAYIFFEIKYKDAKLSLGQRIALERLVNDTAKLGKKSILLVAEHQTHDTADNVDVASCKIRCFFYAGKWTTPDNAITVNDAVTKFLDTL